MTEKHISFLILFLIISGIIVTTFPEEITLGRTKLNDYLKESNDYLKESKVPPSEISRIRTDDTLFIMAEIAQKDVVRDADRQAATIRINFPVIWCPPNKYRPDWIMGCGRDWRGSLCGAAVIPATDGQSVFCILCGRTTPLSQVPPKPHQR